ncbi:hypothetical protein [Massilia sp. TS11]|uniref:hypothetical protein n=1 Tax=Massilia sp. TS11 TaxID=2908003 RepID=UPI001EDB5D88|nr:hypothetical protein [Massilia sp. TS11]MCG2584152.1 hypothetical protein [Massilia sp. TS11]
MAIPAKSQGNPPNQNGTPSAAPTPAPASAGAAVTPSTITGTFAGPKPPAVNGVAALIGGALQSFTAAAPVGTASSAMPKGLTPVHLVGDLTNGVAVADTKSIYFLTGVGVTGAVWNKLAAPAGMSNIVAMCGDLMNGLVVTDGTNIYAWCFSGTSANEWVPLAQLPAPGKVTDMAGDPTAGVLLTLSNGSGPSSLYFGGAGCACSWVPVTSAGTSLPTARVAVQNLCGNYANGFVLYGENQLFTLTSLKYQAGTTAAAGSCSAALTKITNVPPFTITDLTGDPANGITARSGDVLIAWSSTPYASWTLVTAAPPPAPAASGGSGQSAGTPAPTQAPVGASQAPAPVQDETVAEAA